MQKEKLHVEITKRMIRHATSHRHSLCLISNIFLSTSKSIHSSMKLTTTKKETLSINKKKKKILTFILQMANKTNKKSQKNYGNTILLKALQLITFMTALWVFKDINEKRKKSKTIQALVYVYGGKQGMKNLQQKKIFFALIDKTQCVEKLQKKKGKKCLFRNCIALYSLQRDRQAEGL